MPLMSASAWWNTAMPAAQPVRLPWAGISSVTLCQSVSRMDGAGGLRFIAGTTRLSNHSFGLALDLNVPGNQRGTVGEMNRDVVQIFESWGFTWGGHWPTPTPCTSRPTGS